MATPSVVAHVQMSVGAVNDKIPPPKPVLPVGVPKLGGLLPKPALSNERLENLQTNPIIGLPGFSKGLPLPSEDAKEDTNKPVIRRSRLRIKEDPVAAVDNTWTIERITTEAVPEGWEKVFAEAKHELKQISDLLVKDNEAIGGCYVPDAANVFRAFRLTPLNKVRVVIVGQDPYYQIRNDGQPVAQGLAFSTPRGEPIQASLRNIFTEVKNCYPDFQYPSHGCLDAWAQQGVLLLNISLTTRPGTANAHGKYMMWMPLLVRVFNAIAKANPTCIYVLWGREAQKIRSKIGDKSIVLEAAHPSPQSVTNFYGCKHFRMINERLLGNPINWQV